MRLSRLAPLAALLGLAACQSDSLVAPATSRLQTRPGVDIVNSPAVLASRVHDAGGAPIAIVGEDPAIMSLKGNDNAMDFTLQLNIDAPVVGDLTLPASHIIFRGTRAYVSYAPAGETLVGAVDVFDISTPQKPELISSALYKDAKITTMAINGDMLYLGTVSSAAEFEDAPAVLEAVLLDDQGRLTEKSMRVSAPSHVITGIAVASNNVWVVSGTSEKEPGGITVYDPASFEMLYKESLADLRAVSVNGNVVTVLAGTDARMRLYDAASFRFLREFAIGGLRAPGHKATIANTGNWAFVAAGDSGVVFSRIRQNGTVTGTKLLSWGSPAGLAGVRDEDAVTNAVAVSGSYAYAANGGAGVWVARGNWSSTAQNQVPSITPIGRLDLPGVSSNMVGVYGGSLFVAAGMGGLKIIQQPTP